MTVSLAICLIKHVVIIKKKRNLYTLSSPCPWRRRTETPEIKWVHTHNTFARARVEYLSPGQAGTTKSRRDKNDAEIRTADHKNRFPYLIHSLISAGVKAGSHISVRVKAVHQYHLEDQKGLRTTSSLVGLRPAPSDKQATV